MTSQQERFAALICQIEDMHAIAIEGHSPTSTPDVEAALLGCLTIAVTAVSATIDEIACYVGMGS